MLRQQLDTDFGILSRTPGMLSFARGNKGRSAVLVDMTPCKRGRDDASLEAASGEIAGKADGGSAAAAAMGITGAAVRAPALVPALGLAQAQGSAVGSGDAGGGAAGAAMARRGRQEGDRKARGVADEGKDSTGRKELEAGGAGLIVSKVRAAPRW